MGVPEKIDPGPSWRTMLGSPGMWTEFLPGMVRLGWSPDRRRRCGNVEIARPCFWRDFQARGEAWKSPGASFSPPRAAGGTFPRFPRRVISTATLSLPLPVRGVQGAARDGGGSACRDEGQPRVFFPGGKAVRDNTDHSGPQSRSLSQAEREALFKRLRTSTSRFFRRPRF
jgi:hypothetical protein